MATVPLMACHTMEFNVGSAGISEVVHERKAFFLWGLAPTRHVDVGTHCEDGAVAIREETGFLDGFLGLITLGIYSPRSSWYQCAERDTGAP
jgi:hypothetical protein